VSQSDSIPKGDKREAIMQAVLEIVAEFGLQHTPMSLISKRAGASAGVIYHYFESKGDLIQTIYARLLTDLSHGMLAMDDPQQPLVKRFQTLLLSTFHYCIDHPQEMAFMEQYETLPLPKPDKGLSEEALATLNTLWTDLRTQDLIKNLPDEVMGEFTLGVMRRLAQQSAAGVITLDETMLRNVASACWDAIAR
jgi:AcrR family transcriptional regulator